jgi:hypothetical protein
MAITARQNRSFPEFRDLPDEATLEDVISEWGKMVDQLNFLSRNFSIQSNFNCQVLDLEFSASEQKRVFHRLGSVPRYRLILRQEGNGLITDVPLEWTDNYITLKNNGAVAVKITVALLKE